MHPLFESLRPRVVIYSKIALSLSRPRWFLWMASNADPSSTTESEKVFRSGENVSKQLKFYKVIIFYFHLLV